MILLKIPLIKPLLAVTASIAVAAVALQPTIQVALIGLAGNILVVVLGFFLKSKMSDLHILINSRMSELLKLTDSSARAEGVQTGIIQTQEKQAIKDQEIKEGKDSIA
jgi:hypothetical protein